MRSFLFGFAGGVVGILVALLAVYIKAGYGDFLWRGLLR